MRFYTLEKRTNFLKSPGVTTYHSYLFHGQAKREGRVYPNDRRIGIEEIEPPPLCVILNKHNLSEFVWPGRRPVVSAAVRDSLGELNYVKFQPVVKEKLITYPWDVGVSLGIERSDLSTEAFFQLFQSEPVDLVGEYYELQGLQYIDFPAHLNAITRPSVDIILGTEPLDAIETIGVSKLLFQEVPLFFCGLAMILNESVFARVTEFINSNFFIVRNYEQV